MLRAMVLGKFTSLYEDLFEFYFATAAKHGLAGPQAAALGPAVGDARKKPSLVAVTLDFKTAQHNGLFRALGRVFGGVPSTYHGRAVGCGVHFKRFLLAACWNSTRDPFFVRVQALRDGGLAIAEVREQLAGIIKEYESAGDAGKANILRWLLRNDAALFAAFPRCCGVLSNAELLAAPDNTKVCESLNRRTKQVVSEGRATTLMDVIQALADFDAREVQEASSSVLAAPPSQGTVARMRRAVKRKQRTNTVPPSGQPPKSRRKTPKAVTATDT